MAAKKAVLLCGGRGQRLGKMGDLMPKAMMPVSGKPLFWYILNTLDRFDFTDIILPLGYRGDMIRDYITGERPNLKAKIHLQDTGVETSIAGRIHQVASLLTDVDDFFLLNGDTYFDFDVNGMHTLHRREDVDLTLAVGESRPPFSLIVEDEGKPVAFRRDKLIEKAQFAAKGEAAETGSIYTGFAWISTKALEKLNLSDSLEFEETLYPKLIEEGRAQLYRIGHRWFAVDTEKDVARVNANAWVQDNIDHRHRNRDLRKRYSYESRYFDDPDMLREQILNKTVVPHQLEVQPGPTSTKSLCWLKCPYCYGLSAEDTGERLSPERYVEVLRQAAVGGIKKFIFAGYATDPLNYRHIDDLVKVAIDHGSVTGFHTKAIKVSMNLADLICRSDNAPLSYFSVSVDAGTNETYAKVHGVEGNRVPLYDRVLGNIRRLADLREKTGAHFDLSATYLVNEHNHSPDEVRKSIADLKAAGVDLLRFSFPQPPRGYTEEISEFVPGRENVGTYMAALSPIIEEANSEQCQVLMLDLDSQYDIYGKDRTLPCFARFLFPSVGFDGYLAHCSESAAPHFRDMMLADLSTTDFWDAFYNYPADQMASYFAETSAMMKKNNCKCDRKEHVVNNVLGKSGIFSDITGAPKVANA